MAYRVQEGVQKADFVDIRALQHVHRHSRISDAYQLHTGAPAMSLMSQHTSADQELQREAGQRKDPTGSLTCACDVLDLKGQSKCYGRTREGLTWRCMTLKLKMGP